MSGSDVKGDPMFQLVYPTEKPHVTSPFSASRTITLNGIQITKAHSGVDFRAADGTKILAAAAGRVIRSDYSSGDAFPIGHPNKRFYGYGEVIYVEHAHGYVTRYAHLRERLVNVGDAVQAGQQIAWSGNTGDTGAPHLHFEVRKRIGGKDIPVDPMDLLPKLGAA